MRYLLLASLASLAPVFSGCSSDNDTPDFTPAIHVEPSEANRWGSRDIEMPETHLRFQIVGRPVVPEGNFADVEVYEVGPPDMRRKVLLAQVDKKAAGELYALSGKALNKRLFLLVNDKPVGVHLIEQPLLGGDVFFDVEMPGATPAEKDKAIYRLRDDLNATILKIRKKKEDN